MVGQCARSGGSHRPHKSSKPVKDLELMASSDGWIDLRVIVAASPLSRTAKTLAGAHPGPSPGSIERGATVAGEGRFSTYFVRPRRHLFHGLARGGKLPLVELAI